MSTRTARYERATKETRIEVALDLDGTGKAEVATGVGFADHMLTLFAFWARVDLTLTCQGDLEIDAHHRLVDLGLCLARWPTPWRQAQASSRTHRAGPQPMDED
jgi:imidazoleglycerol-phosphate dehydratase